jgi:hypothetical protein
MEHFVNDFGGIRDLNRPEEAFVSAQSIGAQPKASFVSMRSGASVDSTGQWEQASVAAAPTAAATLSLSMERFSDRIELIEHMVGQCIEAISELAEPDGDAPASEGPDIGPGDGLARLEDRIGAQLDALSARLHPQPPPDIDRLAAQLHTHLRQMETRLDAIAARPVPRPDLSDQRSRIAQILVAISTISRRQEAVMEQIEERLATFVAQQDKRSPVLDTETVATQIQAHLDARMEAFETTLKALVADGQRQDKQSPVLDAEAVATQIQAHLDARMEAFETTLKTLVADGQRQDKTLTNISRAYERHTKKLLLKLDGLQAAPPPDITALATQICAAVQDGLAQARDTEAHADVAPDLVRSLRCAVAEMLAEVAQKTRQDGPAAELLPEPLTGQTEGDTA